MASVQTSAEIDALLHPARQYQSPAEVLADPSLTLSERRAILSGAPGSSEAVDLLIFSLNQLLVPAVVVSSMRVMMGILKSKHGVYYVRKKVPPKLETAVSTVLGASRSRVSWLKRSLHTKDLREANIKAKPVQMEFDRVLSRAEACCEQRLFALT
jgi:hypothetical protein